MSSVALSRNPSRSAALWNGVAGLGTLISRWFRRSAKINKDRRTLQTVPSYLLADMGLERVEIRTSTGSQDLWIAPRRQ